MLETYLDGEDNRVSQYKTHAHVTGSWKQAQLFFDLVTTLVEPLYQTYVTRKATGGKSHLHVGHFNLGGSPRPNSPQLQPWCRCSWYPSRIHCEGWLLQNVSVGQRTPEGITPRPEKWPAEREGAQVRTTESRASPLRTDEDVQAGVQAKEKQAEPG